MSERHLRGLTWSHTRGFSPLAGLGQVWNDQRPGQRVTWEARSLKSFGDEPLAAYVDSFDLFVFDYPFSGAALSEGWVRPLDEVLAPEVLQARREGTVGRSFEAFRWNGQSAAIPIDVATHVAASRPDLLAAHGVNAPRTWEETVELARQSRAVAIPLTPHGAWGAFLTLCSHLGDEPFRRADGGAFDRVIARQAFARLAQLAQVVDPECYTTSPIVLLNRMASSASVMWCPLLYSYSVYSARSYARANGWSQVAFHDIRISPDSVSGAILGGAGIGLSAGCKDPELAAEHIAWLTSPEVQSGLYGYFGGQPSARAAWLDPDLNAFCDGFYAATLQSAEKSYYRPNKPGFHHFQDAAAHQLQKALREQGDFEVVIDDFEATWRALQAL